MFEESELKLKGFLIIISSEQWSTGLLQGKISNTLTYEPVRRILLQLALHRPLCSSSARF